MFWNDPNLYGATFMKDMPVQTPFMFNYPWVQNFQKFTPYNYIPYNVPQYNIPFFQGQVPFNVPQTFMPYNYLPQLQPFVDPQIPQFQGFVDPYKTLPQFQGFVDPFYKTLPQFNLYRPFI